MSRKIFYEKIGDQYVPVAEYDSELLDSFPAGSHLLVCTPGTRSYVYNIEPALAPMIAAGKIAEQSMLDAIWKASEMQPSKTPITLAQKLAWTNLANVFGDERYSLRRPSAIEIVDAGITAMMNE